MPRLVHALPLGVLHAVFFVACASAPASAPPSKPCPTVAIADAAPPDAALPPPKLATDQALRELVAAYNTKDPKRSFGLMNAAMQASFPLEKEAAWIDQMLSHGELLAILRVGGDDRHGIFDIRAEHGLYRAEVSVDNDGKITALNVKELKVEPVVMKSTLPLGLPFRGQWLVFWGGETPAVNQHIGSPSQRRAADLLKVDAEGKDHTGDGKKNTDYLAFGADVLAVADGTVLNVTDGVPDNDPGVLNPYVLTGNSVTIEHEGKVFSVYAHLKDHSVKVREGMKVKKGTVLGACGNSGQTSQPHLHFQLEDGPSTAASWGIEPVFPEVILTRDGKTSKGKDYTFLKGDRIEAPKER